MPTHAAPTAASVRNLASFLAGIVFVTGRTTAVGLPSLPDTISAAQHQPPAAACQPRGRKPSPFLSGNYISPCYNEILSVIKFQSEQADFLICRDFISLWNVCLPSFEFILKLLFLFFFLFSPSKIPLFQVTFANISLI